MMCNRDTIYSYYGTVHYVVFLKKKLYFYTKVNVRFPTMFASLVFVMHVPHESHADIMVLPP